MDSPPADQPPAWSRGACYRRPLPALRLHAALAALAVALASVPLHAAPPASGPTQAASSPGNSPPANPPLDGPTPRNSSAPDGPRSGPTDHAVGSSVPPRAPGPVSAALPPGSVVPAPGSVPAPPSYPPPGKRCPVITGGSDALAGLDTEARLEFIRGRLRHDAWRARQWSWGFGSSYAILTAASLVIAPNMKDVASRPDIYVGAGSAGVGLGLIVLAPLTVMRDSDALEHHLAHAGPDVDRCRLLAIAEAMLIRDAQSEKFGRGWFTQTGNALLGVAATLILGLGYQRWVSGVVNGIASIGVGELMILTQPIGLVRDLRNYRAGSLVVPARRRQRVSWSLTPNLAIHSYGLQLVGRF